MERTSLLPIQIVTNTWGRDSHDLFDFESKQMQTETFELAGARRAHFVRSGEAVSMVHGTSLSSDNTAAEEHEENILRLFHRDGSVWADKPAAGDLPRQKAFLVVNSLPSQSHCLAEGDLIKLGLLRYRVQQVVKPSCGECVRPIISFGRGRHPRCASGEMEPSAGTVCRICLGGDISLEDPMIQPCNCKGSIQHVHVECLRHWVSERLQSWNRSRRAGASDFYGRRSMSCELCKASYAEQVGTRAGQSPLIEAPALNCPFIVLESMAKETRGLHVLPFTEETVVKLGRSHDADVRGLDVSISRCHARIRFDGKDFLLEDNGSKFGTLVAMRKPIELTLGTSFSIQVGRTVLSISSATDLQTTDSFQGVPPLEKLHSTGSSNEDDDCVICRTPRRRESECAEICARPSTSSSASSC